MTPRMQATLRTDGGARGNPGPAGIGFVLTGHDEQHIARGGAFIGEATNNIAEYRALLWGLRVADEAGVSVLKVYSDSELLVKQMNGVYRVKHPNMKPLFEQAKSLVARFERVTIAHIRREQNSEADALANEAMDCRGTVGDATGPSRDDAQESLF